MTEKPIYTAYGAKCTKPKVVDGFAYMTKSERFLYVTCLEYNNSVIQNITQFRSMITM